VLNEFKEHFKIGQQLAVMPISRVELSQSFKIQNFVLYPVGEVDLNQLRPLPNRSIESESQLRSDYSLRLEGQALRQVLANQTGFSLDILNSNVLIAFPIKLDWQEFLR
jgi:hypothetical protein